MTDKIKKTPKPRFVAETSEEFHIKIKEFCVRKKVKMNDFVHEAIQEKYLRESSN